MLDRNIDARCCPINPDAIYPFVDRVRIWSHYRPTTADLAPFRRLRCRLRVFPPRERFQRWTIEFYQPSAAALTTIARREDWPLSFAELALDWIFGNDFDRDDAKAYFDQRYVQLWHRGEVRFVRGTRYSRDRKARVNIVAYADRPSKVTGELYCLHVEARIRGARALHSNGIDNAADLIGFDHTQFWQRYLLFYDLNAAGLGRRALNQQHHTRRHQPLILRYGRFSYDRDSRVGWHHFQLSRSMQMLIHDCQHLNVRSYLMAMDVAHLLPRVATHYSDYTCNYDSNSDKALSQHEIMQIQPASAVIPATVALPAE